MSVKKFLGGDCEFSATGVDPQGHPLRQFDLTQSLLACGDEIYRQHNLQSWRARAGTSGYGWYNPSDFNRIWTPTGGCRYCDCAHPEYVVAESLYGRRYAAQLIANMQSAELARQAAEAEAPEGTRIRMCAENVDPMDPGISWGTHTNVNISKPLWEDLYKDHRHPNIYGFVVSGLAAATALFGSGYLLPLRSGEVVYSLAARAHHLGKLTSYDTTIAYKRGVTNSRREGFSDADEERQHLINFDYSPVSARLRASFLQALFAAAEEGYCGFNLFDPLKALRTWSLGLDTRTGRLPETAQLADGRQVTLPGYMGELCTKLMEMVEGRLISSSVAPEAAEMLPQIIELTAQLERGSLAAAARHLDWAAKFLVLLTLCGREGAAMGDAQTRLASFDYTNTDPQRGWFWRLWDDDKVDPLVSRDDVDAAIHESPPESRAWGRGAIIRKFREDITAIDWDYIELRRNGKSSHRWSSRMRIDFPELDSFCRAKFEPIIERARSVNHLEELLEAPIGRARERPRDEPGGGAAGAAQRRHVAYPPRRRHIARREKRRRRAYSLRAPWPLAGWRCSGRCSQS